MSRKQLADAVNDNGEQTAFIAEKSDQINENVENNLIYLRKQKF